jgi:pyruvyl transferase EpsI
MNKLKNSLEKLFHIIKTPGRLIKHSRPLRNLRYAYTHRNLRYGNKIIYALTPPPYLSNVGDHAQAVAIRTWMNKHFHEVPILEVDKDQSKYYLPALRWLVRPGDIIFLHSGGNLGDRGIWSESIRRLIIQSFPNNLIVSLPQTIYFSDTEKGRREKENTRRIYASHPNLIIIARDPQSGELAKELFPKAQTFCMPDFVLSLPLGFLTEDQRKKIGVRLPYPCTYYDTTLPEPIEIDQRETVLENTLALFRESDVIVTDRYHGVIFAVLCQKPCVVVRTVDHKLISAMDWFTDIRNVVFANNIDEIPAMVEHCLAIKMDARGVVDWNGKYFNQIPKLIGLSQFTTHEFGSTGKKQYTKYPYCDLNDLSNDELLSLMRHESHRIEKATYNNQLEAKIIQYQEKIDRLGLIYQLLNNRGYPQDEPTIVWSKQIYNDFYNGEREFIQKNSLPAPEINLQATRPFIEFLQRRRSIRVWADVQPSQQVLEEIAYQMINAARWAPNSGNRQPWRFLLLKDTQEKQLLRRIKEAHCVNAPMLIFVGMDARVYGALSKSEVSIYIDAGAAIMQMILVAHKCGFGACWNHFADDLVNSNEKNREIYLNFTKELHIPDFITPIAIVAFGIPKFIPPRPSRMDINNMMINSSNQVYCNSNSSGQVIGVHHLVEDEVKGN